MIDKEALAKDLYWLLSKMSMPMPYSMIEAGLAVQSEDQIKQFIQGADQVFKKHKLIK